MPDIVYLLWEKSLSGVGQNWLMGVYSSREDAERDAATDGRWYVQAIKLDHESVVAE